VTLCDRGGRGGQKVPKKMWHNFWMAPYSSVSMTSKTVTTCSTLQRPVAW